MCKQSCVCNKCVGVCTHLIDVASLAPQLSMPSLCGISTLPIVTPALPKWFSGRSRCWGIACSQLSKVSSFLHYLLSGNLSHPPTLFSILTQEPQIRTVFLKFNVLFFQLKEKFKAGIRCIRIFTFYIDLQGLPQASNTFQWKPLFVGSYYLCDVPSIAQNLKVSCMGLGSNLIPFPGHHGHFCWSWASQELSLLPPGTNTTMFTSSCHHQPPRYHWDCQALWPFLAPFKKCYYLYLSLVNTTSYFSAVKCQNCLVQWQLGRTACLSFYVILIRKTPMLCCLFFKVKCSVFIKQSFPFLLSQSG